jgi:transketolase
MRASNRAAAAILARNVRKRILEISSSSGGPNHLGGSLSIVEILAVLYGEILNYRIAEPDWELRDRFILSKGHAALALFVILNEVGVISDETLNTFKQDESDLIAHPVRNLMIGVESSNGSLGQGLSVGAGIALGGSIKGVSHRVFVLVGDGECNEGAIWEAAMFAAHHQLGNLTVIVDNNGFQSDGPVEQTLGLGDLAAKWKSFGWNVAEVDGHNVNDLFAALTSRDNAERPSCVIAHTVKGKGVPFMESNNEWHHNRLTANLLEDALESLKQENDA